MTMDIPDDLPVARRPDLSLTAACRVVTAATKAALEAPEEESLAVLTRHMSAVLPTDPCSGTIDAWARHGLMAGAQAAWDGIARNFPPDLPNTLAHRLLYMGGHALALGWVHAVRADEGVRHGG